MKQNNIMIISRPCGGLFDSFYDGNISKRAFKFH